MWRWAGNLISGLLLPSIFLGTNSELQKAAARWQKEMLVGLIELIWSNEIWLSWIRCFASLLLFVPWEVVVAVGWSWPRGLASCLALCRGQDSNTSGCWLLLSADAYSMHWMVSTYSYWLSIGGRTRRNKKAEHWNKSVRLGELARHEVKLVHMKGWGCFTVLGEQ